MYIFIREMQDESELVNIKIDELLLIRKFLIIIKKIFNVAIVKKIDDFHYLYIIPRCNQKRLNKIKSKNVNAKIILSGALKTIYKNYHENGKSIIYFLEIIIDYIMNKLQIRPEEQNLFICVNKYNELNIEVIKYMIDRFKNLTIVTDNVKQFKILENKLYKNFGILITITNSKNNALKNANFVVNLDFSSVDFKRYRVNKEALIANCYDDKFDLSFFQGIIVDNVRIYSREIRKDFTDLYSYFDLMDLYASIVFFKEKWYNNIYQIKSDGVEIKSLVGSNGLIDENELKMFGKNIDKIKKLD